jgi:WS/DGAT/MGAT family acyltransferase
MDDPQNLMIITGLMTLATPLEYELLKKHVEDTLLRYERFRQRISPSLIPGMRPSWEEDPNFEIEAHLERIEFSAAIDQGGLQELISVLMGTPLDYTRPLWKLYLVEYFESGSALIARLHHCIADGISLMQVLLSMTSDSPNAAVELRTANGKTVKTAKAALLQNRTWTAQELLDEGRKMLQQPSHAKLRLRQGVDFASAVGKLALRWPDPNTIFKGPLRVEKRCAWSQPLSLNEVKAVGKAFNATVNDVLISCAAGALGGYLDSHGMDISEMNIRGLVPINLRPIEIDGNLGNKFGMLFLSMPVGLADPLERLEQVKRNMDRLKSSTEPLATFGVINVLGAIPGWTEEIAVGFFDSKCTAVITNVPGPQTQRYLAGAPINTLMAWVPQSGRIALGVSIISYNGLVWLGIATDQGLVPDPETIVGSFEQEFELLKARMKEVPPGRSGELRSLLGMLDEAIEKVDGMLENPSDNSIL